jgi:hypothetical protein
MAMLLSGREAAASIQGNKPLSEGSRRFQLAGRERDLRSLLPFKIIMNVYWVYSTNHKDIGILC